MGSARILCHGQWVGWCFGPATNQAEADAALFDRIAASFELFPPKVEAALPDSVLAGYYPNPRKAVAIAQEYAFELGQSMSSAHIAVGLVEAGDGVAFEVLTSLGVSAERLRAEIDAERRSAAAGAATSVAVSPSAYRLLATTARTHAAALGHGYIGTEHLLLGILTEPDDDGWRLLAQAGVDRGAARGALADHLERGIERIVRGVSTS